MLCNLSAMAIQGGLYSGPYAVEAARRYEQIWLPMLAQGSSLCDSFSAIPPLDVAFTWLVHRLNPAAYAADIKRIFGEEKSASALSRGYNSRQAPTRYLAGTRVESDDVAQGGPFAFTNACKEDLKGPHSVQIVATIRAWANYVKQPGITQADVTLSKVWRARSDPCTLLDDWSSKHAWYLAMGSGTSAV